MRSAASRYGVFVRRHRRFLSDHPDADIHRRKRPLRYIEEEAVECALWPHLYWDAQLCETVTRLSDIRRQASQSAEDAAADAGEDTWEGDDDLLSAGRQSLKRNFLAKALGPIADYAGEHELAHFVFDLAHLERCRGQEEPPPGQTHVAGNERWRRGHHSIGSCGMRPSSTCRHNVVPPWLSSPGRPSNGLRPTMNGCFGRWEQLGRERLRLGWT